MNNKTNKPLGSKVIEMILTIATVILIFSTIAFIFQFIDEYKRYEVSQYSESSFKYAVEEGEYARLAEYVKLSEPLGNPPASTRRFFSLGRYFYDQTMVSLAETMGDEELKSYWEDQRDKARAVTDSSMLEYILIMDQKLSRY
ncbi:hypothetical protein SAMN02910292_01278 [Lachnospiraceae bacterium XBB2008]|nr:hypothetical protein SAMN02910292_01278 [Lachnospiraceae bacterium XBB2008]